MINYLNENERDKKASADLLEFLVEILNAAAISGGSDYLLAKRLDIILTSDRGEGRSIRELMLRLVDMYCSGLITDLAAGNLGLSRSEIAICAMSVIGMEPATICKICKYENEQSFYNRRADIRRKIGLERQASLEGYLLDRAESLKRQRESRIAEMIM